MRKRSFFQIIIIAGIILFFARSASGQTFFSEKPEKLQERLDQSKADTTRVKILLSISRDRLFRSGAAKSDLDSAKLLMRQALGLSERLHDLKWQGNSRLIAAMLLNKEGQAEKGLKEAQTALGFFKKINDLSDQAEAYIIIGQHYSIDGPEISQRIDYYRKAADIFIKARVNDRAGSALQDIGDFQSYSDNSAEALKTHQAALGFFTAAKKTDLQYLYDLMGYDYSRIGDYINGLKYGLLAVKTAEVVKDSSLGVCTIYNRLGYTYGLLKQYESSNQYRRKAMQIALKYRDTASIRIVGFNLAATLINSSKAKEALEIIKMVERITRKVSKPEYDVQIAYFYLKSYIFLKDFNNGAVYFRKLRSYAGVNLGSLESTEQIIRGTIFYYQSTGQFETSYQYIREHQKFCAVNHMASFVYPEHLWWFKADSALKKYPSAIKHYQRYKVINDSVLNEKRNQQATALNVQYESDRKDRAIQLKAQSIQLLEKKNQLQEVNSRQQQVVRNAILIVVGMLILMLSVTYNRFRTKRRSNILLNAQQAEINKQNGALIVYNKKQTALLKEKEWLLKEIHHRVKNNLQITMSLLNIQCSYMADNDALGAIQDSQRRMHAMSLIHQKLYQSDNLALIDMAIYIPELVAYLKDSFDGVNKVTFEIRTPALELDIAQAVPLGLILNEAITNAIKYAFPEKGTGRITIALRELTGDEYVLTVADNGKGLPDSFDFDTHNSLGMNLMRGLSHQLQGEIEIMSDNGVVISVRFATVNRMENELHLIESGTA